MQLHDSASALRSALLDRAWIQWTALGVDALVEKDDAVVDPEALVALTAEIGADDVRLLDVSSDWCVSYGTYINGSRLKRVAREMKSPPGLIGEYAATVAKAGGPRWSMATEPRSGYFHRGKARLDTAASNGRLRVRLRAAFGVNARADVLAALLTRPLDEMRIADLARTTRFSKENVTVAVDALVLAGLVRIRSVGNERRASLATKSFLLPSLRGPIPQPDWIHRFGPALLVLRFLEGSDLSPTVFAIEARRVMDSARNPLSTEGAPILRDDAFGDEFMHAFRRWLVDFTYWLRLPSKT